MLIIHFQINATFKNLVKDSDVAFIEISDSDDDGSVTDLLPALEHITI